jgi:hypothetical protein
VAAVSDIAAALRPIVGIHPANAGDVDHHSDVCSAAANQYRRTRQLLIQQNS